jgi:NAD(P)-dependent dehydrogenase (short-subunit alcohol dehydrogenase family)
MNSAQRVAIVTGASRGIRAGLVRSTDIVDALLYLESASFVAGEICHVDGGEAAGVA